MGKEEAEHIATNTNCQAKSLQQQKAWQMRCCDLYGDSYDGAASPTPAEAAAALFAVSSFARLKNLKRVFARKGPELFAFADLKRVGKLKEGRRSGLHRESAEKPYECFD
jgi:hypothetical protein